MHVALQCIALARVNVQHATKRALGNIRTARVVPDETNASTIDCFGEASMALWCRLAIAMDTHGKRAAKQRQTCVSPPETFDIELESRC